MNVTIAHSNWRTDPEAIERPWVIKVNDNVVARVSSVNGAGDIARKFEPNASKWNWDV